MLYGILFYFLNENLSLFENLHSFPRKPFVQLTIIFCLSPQGKKSPPKKTTTSLQQVFPSKIVENKAITIPNSPYILNTQTITIMKYENTNDSRVTGTCWSEGWKKPTVHLPHFGL